MITSWRASQPDPLDSLYISSSLERLSKWDKLVVKG